MFVVIDIPWNNAENPVVTVRSDQFTFRNNDGEELSGRLELPSREVQAFAVFAHCFTCSKNVVATSRISRELRNYGIAVLRFDFTGLGNSEGDFAITNFSSNVEDVVAAADSLRERFQAPSLLVGHSLGGAAVLAAAARISEVRAVATIGAPSEPAFMVKLLGDYVARIEEEGLAAINLAGRRFTIRKQFLEDVTETSLREQLPKMRKALLIYHSPTDKLVNIEHARLIYDSAKHPKSFISLDGADHLLTRKEDAEFVARTLAAWASRYLGQENPVHRTLMGEKEISMRLKEKE